MNVNRPLVVAIPGDLLAQPRRRHPAGGGDYALVSYEATTVRPDRDLFSYYSTSAEPRRNLITYKTLAKTDSSSCW